MQLLIAVVNQEEKLDQILAGFLELGITGATVIRSEGMGSVLSHDVPIFAGLQTLIARARPPKPDDLQRDPRRREGAGRDRTAAEGVRQPRRSRDRHRIHRTGQPGRRSRAPAARSGGVTA
jgi:hypothetical protein